MVSVQATQIEHDKVRQWVEGYLNPCPVSLSARYEASQALDRELPKLAFLPGTGLQSGALAQSYSAAGFPIIVGSRTAEKAEAQAENLKHATRNQRVEAANLAEAAERADIVFWLVPTTNEEQWRDSIELLKSLEPSLGGKIVIDVTNILWFHDQSSWGQTSSTLLIAEALLQKSKIRLVAAFKHTYYYLLLSDRHPPESNPHNVFVCADDPDAATTVLALVDRLPGFRGLYAGNLQYSKIVELLSPLWLAQLERDNFTTLFHAGWRFGV